MPQLDIVTFKIILIENALISLYSILFTIIICLPAIYGTLKTRTLLKKKNI